MKLYVAAGAALLSLQLGHHANAEAAIDSQLDCKSLIVAPDEESWVLEPQVALECANQLVTLPSGIAKQHLDAMVQMYSNFYTFYDAAKDPLKSKQSNKLGYKVWDESKVDLGAELNALRSSLPNRDDTTVRFFDYYFGVKDTFRKLRDVHVDPPMEWNGAAQYVDYVFAVDGQTHAQGFGMELSNTTSGSAVLTHNNRPLSKVDGQDPIEWFYSTFVDDTRIHYSGDNMQSRAVRMTEALKYFSNGRAIRSMVNQGDFTRVKLPVTFQYADDGSQAEFRAAMRLTQGIESVNPVVGNKRYDALEAAQLILAQSKRKSEGRKLQAEEEAGIKTKCDSEKCVFAIKDFMMDPEVYVAKWDAMVAEAQTAGITKLVYDVNNNGGGSVATAFTAAKRLVPSMTVEDCPKYRYRLGSFVDFLQTRGLRGETVRRTISKLVPSLDSRRASNLMARNCMTGQRIFDRVLLIANATETYFSIVEGGQSQGDLTAWQKQITGAKEACMAGTLTPETVQNLFDMLISMGEGIVAGSDYLMQDKTDRLVRGGVGASYSAPYDLMDLCPKAMVPTDTMPEAPAHPFKDVRIFGSGNCGSSCSTATLTAYLYSKATPAYDGPAISFVNWGGDGRHPKENGMTGTSFQGGNVADSDILSSPMFIYMSLLDSITQLSGAPRLNRIVQRAAALIPTWSQGEPTLPRFTQTEIFAPKQLGENSLPLELYTIMPEHYIKAWFLGVNDWSNLDDTTVQQAHAMVAALD